MRIDNHPILDFKRGKRVTIQFNGNPIEAYEGETIAAALHAAGVYVLAHSLNAHRPRGIYCAIGNCSSCMMVVNNMPNVKTCITEVQDGMDVRLQEGKGMIV